MADTEMKLSGVGAAAKKIFAQVWHSKTGLLLSFLAAGGILYFVVVAPLSLRVHRMALPDLPDSSGQPGPVAEYLKATYDEAMDHPTSDEAVGKLGMAFHAHLFYDQAAACYRRAHELKPDEWRWLYYDALIDEELGNTKTTIEALKSVIQRQPAYPMAWFRLGSSYVKVRSFDEAERAFQQVLQLPEDLSPNIGGVHVSAKGAFPLKTYAILEMARIRHLQQRYTDAQSLLVREIEAHPTFGPALRLLGDVYHAMGKEDEAAQCKRGAGDLLSYVPPADGMYNALVLCSRSTEFIMRQINIAMRWDNFEFTIALLDHILAYDPRDGETLAFKIKLELDTQQINEVTPLVARYAELYRSDERKLVEMAKYLRRWGQYDPTVAILKSIFALKPQAVEAHVEYVRLMKMFRQYQQGIEYCVEFLAKDPRNPQMRIELVDLLIQVGELDKAERELKTEQLLYPDKETRSLMMGRLTRKKGDAGNAVRYYQQALAANPRSNAIHLELGKYLMEVRRWNDAAKEWLKALQASPTNIDFAGQYALLIAACPDPGIRDGNKAVELSQRLMPVKKETVEQDIVCAIALASALAETQQYDKALSVAEEYRQLSTNYQKTESVGQWQALIKLFESRKPYRL